MGVFDEKPHELIPHPPVPHPYPAVVIARPGVSWDSKLFVTLKFYRDINLFKLQPSVWLTCAQNPNLGIFMII